ncbi:immunoglobulin I-set domain protein, partial [Dictyocaulus viviparus]
EEEIETIKIPQFESSIERCVVEENGTVTITTVVSGVPTPFIEWYFKDEKLTVSDRISMGYQNKVATLILKNVTQDQEGTYYCRATNDHGTTVLPTEVKVITKSANDTIRLTFTRSNIEEVEQIATNIIVNRKEEQFEELVRLNLPQKAVKSANFISPSLDKQMTQTIKSTSLQGDNNVQTAPKLSECLTHTIDEPIDQSHQTAETDRFPLITLRNESQTAEQVSIRSIAIKFAESLTKHLIGQAHTDFLSIVSRDNKAPRPEMSFGAEGHSCETKESVATLVIEGEAATIGNVTPFPFTSVSAQSSTFIADSSFLSKETCNEQMITVDVRKPDIRFDHLVTVVEPEVVELGLQLLSSSAPSMKFIDLETILQRPGTSSSVNTTISSPNKGSANAEHRIVVLEGTSQNFKNFMTLNLKKIQKLSTGSAEPSTFVQIEILKPNEISEKTLTIVDNEKTFSDTLRAAASTSKLIVNYIVITLIMENVTVSLIKQADSGHQELVIEYENYVECSVDFNLSQLVYCHPKQDKKPEVWSRPSRFSGVDENVVAVFVEVVANCPDQSIEVVASVNMPLETKVDRKPSPDVEVSLSLSESLKAIGQQPPKFFRMLHDLDTTVGKSVQFKCMVSGMPTPLITWYVDGDPIRESQEYKMICEDGVCILRINEVLAEDEGEYSCEASNIVGKAETKCFLKVMNNQASRFIEYVPSMTDFDNTQDSFDSFELEECKANNLIRSDYTSQHSLVTCNSEFDLSKVINYNENMEETNTFHKYFDTREVLVCVREAEPHEKIFASFLVREPEEISVDIVIANSDEYVAVAHRIELPIKAVHNSFVRTQAKQDKMKAIDNVSSFDHEKIFTKELLEPRKLDLPQEMYYKGQKISVSVNEIEKEEMTRNESGNVEVLKKTCLETLVEFDTRLDVSQSVKKSNTLFEQNNTISKFNTENEISITPVSTAPYDGNNLHSLWTNKPTEIFADSNCRQYEISETERTSIGSEVSGNSTISRNSLFDKKFFTKMKKIERIARKVDEELEHLSESPDNSQYDKEIGCEISKISHNLLSQSITEAQAEASEELIRTTLADMILNPSRTVEEEVELMKHSIRLIRRKLSDIENSLIEDVEVRNITEQAKPCSQANMGNITTEAQTQSESMLPCSDYVRVTPLTSNIKEQLSHLEEIIANPMETESVDVSSRENRNLFPVNERTEKKELHDLFVQINNEMNIIKTFCKSKLSKKGTDAVVNVLNKVRNHIINIANIMTLTRGRQLSAIRKNKVDVYVTSRFERQPFNEAIDAVLINEQTSIDNSNHKDIWKIEIEANKGNTLMMQEQEADVKLPIAPPRRCRTLSGVLDSATAAPVRPPRNKEVLKSRDHSLDSKISVLDLTSFKEITVQNLRIFKKDNTTSLSSKLKKSLVRNKLDLLRHLNCVKTRKEQLDGLEEPLLDNADQIDACQSSDAIIPRNVENSEVSKSFMTKERRESKEKVYQNNKKSEQVIDVEQSSNHQIGPAFQLNLPYQKRENSLENIIEINYSGTLSSVAYVRHCEASAAAVIPHRITSAFGEGIPLEDGIGSVHLFCEESDYATDTDTSALVRGTIQLFNNNEEINLKTDAFLNSPNRNSRNLREQIKENEPNNLFVNVDVDFISMRQASEKNKSAGYSYENAFVDTTLLNEASNPEETTHIVLEETILSQMGSSVITDDTDRTVELRETDILSDELLMTETDPSIADSVDKLIEFVRADEEKFSVVVLPQQARDILNATLLADRIIVVECVQHLRSIPLKIHATEDHENSLSLIVSKSRSNNSDDGEAYDEITENSFHGEDGECRTGISVSIIARSLYDGIYASLEEIPWGEVEMTVPCCDMMANSMRDDSKTSIQFNVTVSESNLEEKKSLLSQASLNYSQNTISEIDNTLSNGSINIPSYVIKIGSTATITCELNNYLPPDSNIEWYKGNIQINTCPGKLDRISHDLLEVLIINDVQKEDSDIYSLKVNDEIFPVAYLIVESSFVDDSDATIISPPQTQFVMDGQPTMIMCQVNVPKQSVKWLKDRKPLQETDRIQIDVCEDAELSHCDVCLYTCLERIDEKEVTVVVSGTESEDDDVQEYIVPPGSTATIACELEDSEHMCSLVWLKNGQRLTFTDPNKMEHVKNSLKHYLVIHDTCPKDNGVYSVSISDTEFKVAHLTVNDMATISNSLRRKRISNSSLN